MMDSARFAADILRRPVALVESLERLAADVETWRGRWWLNAFEDMLLPHDLQSTADAVLFAAEAGSAIARRFLETSGLNLQAAAAAVRESRESELQGVPAGLKRCAGSLSAWLRFEAYRERLEAGLELPPLPAINLDELFGDLSEPQKPAPAAAPADSATPHVPAPQPSAEGAADTQPGSALPPSPDAAAAPQGASGAASDSDDQTEVDAKALAVHCGCSDKQIRKVLSHCKPSRKGNRGQLWWKYGLILKTLRQWSEGTDAKRKKYKQWPENAAELQKRKKPHPERSKK